MKSPNEKLIELLFIHHALKICGAKTVLYAPSTREEHEKGYDAQFTGAGGFREIYLQFKTPVVRADKRYTVRINQQQHKTLYNRYPAGTAFYVSHSFESVGELYEDQIKVSDAEKFLARYIAIQVHALTEEPKFVQFVRHIDGLPMLPNYKESKEGAGKIAKNSIADVDWCSGSELIRAFKRNEIGTEWFMERGCLFVLNPNDAKLDYHSKHWAGIAEDRESDFSSFGVMLRKYSDRRS